MIHAVVEEIAQLFIDKGHDAYFGEEVSQWEHASQAAYLAKSRGFDEAFQLAAFLHDVGHLFPHQTTHPTAWDVYGQPQHEDLAAAWLTDKGFSEKVVQLVRSHVVAKRYLCTTNEAYFHELSDASRATFLLQGGRLTEDEIKQCEQLPYWDECLALRRMDDEAKDPNSPLRSLEDLLHLCQEHLTKQTQ